MINPKLSDHKTQLISLTYGNSENQDNECVNHADTEIQEYDLQNGEQDDWIKLNMLFGNINWEQRLRDQTVTEMTEIVLQECEGNVKKIFKRRDGKPNSH